MNLSSSYNAIIPGLSISLLASGGTGPYTYSVVPGGAGGTVNGSTGLYTAPPTISSQHPQELYDMVMAMDSLGATALWPILVGTPLLLFCDILQAELALPPGRVVLWGQKIFQPTDSDLWIAVSVIRCKPFGNVISTDGSGSGLNSVQSVSMMATLDIDIISRGPQARDRKEEVILALNSQYAQQQQEINSFYIGKLPAGSQFLNLSTIDGAAIPYRFKISVNMQYAVSKTKPVPYFDMFEDADVNTNS